MMDMDMKGASYVASNFYDISKAFEAGACFVRTGDPTANGRYTSPSVYDWDHGTLSGDPLDLAAFPTKGLGFHVGATSSGNKRNVRLVRCLVYCHTQRS